MDAVTSWDDFVKDHLLQSNLYCGVCLLSQLGEIVYTYGLLHTISQEETGQFLQAFKTMSQAAEQEIVQRGFTLSIQGHKGAQFKVYSKTYCSIYCTSSDNRLGLTVSKLPYGVLLCLYAHPVTAAKAVKQVELFCDRLRL